MTPVPLSDKELEELLNEPLFRKKPGFLAKKFFEIRDYFYLAGNKVARSHDLELGKNLVSLSFKMQKAGSEYFPLKGKISFLLSHPHIHPWLASLGHIGFNIDMLIKSMILGVIPDSKVILLAPPNEVCNHTFLKYWEKYITILKDNATIQKLYPKARFHENWPYSLLYHKIQDEVMWMNKSFASVQNRWEEENRKPLLEISEKDKERGYKTLQKMGIPKDAWFVCIHARENGYHNHGKNLKNNWRNASIESFDQAIDSITSRGGWVIRLGDSSMSSYKKTDKFIDYANSEYKSDWMDVFLGAECKFFVASNSGILFIPFCFGTPCVMVNTFPLYLRGFSEKDIFITKLFHSKDKYLPFQEAIKNMPFYGNHEDLDTTDLQCIDNTPEEINDVVVEMISRLEMKTDDTNEDVSLQQKFNTFMPDYHNLTNARIGKAFIKKWEHLLN